MSSDLHNKMSQALKVTHINKTNTLDTPAAAVKDLGHVLTATNNNITKSQAVQGKAINSFAEGLSVLNIKPTRLPESQSTRIKRSTKALTAANISRNTAAPASAGSENYACACASSSDDMCVFVDDVWPYLSLLACLLVPLILLATIVAIVLYKLCTRCRRQDHAGSPPEFTSVTVSAVVHTFVALVFSMPLCFLSLVDAGRYWAWYGQAWSGDDAVRDGGFVALSVCRLVFYTQFALRWVVTCFCCQIWTSVRNVCCKSRKT